MTILEVPATSSLVKAKTLARCLKCPLVYGGSLNGGLHVMHCGTDSLLLLLLRLALLGAILYHMILLATVITAIRAHSTLLGMTLAKRVVLDTFGLLVRLTVVALFVALPFLTLSLEIPLLVVVFPVRVIGLLVRGSDWKWRLYAARSAVESMVGAEYLSGDTQLGVRHGNIPQCWLVEKCCGPNALQCQNRKP